MHDFLYGFWKCWEWELILPSNLVFAGQNYYEPLLDEEHVATAHGGVEKIMQNRRCRYHSQLTAVFIKCLSMYPNIETDNDKMLYTLHIWTIVDRHSVCKFLIPIPDTCKAQQCTCTHEVHLLPYIAYPNTIVFDADSLFMYNHFQAWAPSKALLL